MVLLLVAVAVSVPILYYIPGAAVMRLLKLQRERINLYSYSVSTLVYASVAILGHLLGVGQVTLMELVVEFHADCLRGYARRRGFGQEPLLAKLRPSFVTR